MYECLNLQSIHDLPAEDWDALWPTDYPFTQHAFLSALEDSGSVDNTIKRETGWRPFHLVVKKDDKVVAALPLFLKFHSYGEYVFDWSWANAYHQNGLEYYPKLVNSIPFTPATGPRIGVVSDLSSEEQKKIFQTIFEHIKSLSEDLDCSGFHCLFPLESEAKQMSDLGLYQRLGYQFHWFNQSYSSFDDFLSHFSSRKRKNLKKERSKISGVEIKFRDSNSIGQDEWNEFYALYQTTYMKRSGHGGYIGKDFFKSIANHIPDQVLLCSAHENDTMVAAALYFRDESTLYGRYWGCLQEIDGLHFECCYYQGIEYAIKQKIQRFDPGAQGEHKIQRGFTPIFTQSYHWLLHPSFNSAIKNFVKEEAEDIARYLESARAVLPFKEGTNIIDKDILIR